MGRYLQERVVEKWHHVVLSRMGVQWFVVLSPYFLLCTFEIWHG